MVSAFTRDTPVLYYFKPHPHVHWKARRFVLWPAWAYRIVAPDVRRRQLNFLERAVMGLSKAGLYRSGDVAEKLDVDPELAAFIASELMNRGFLDSRGMLSEGGRKALIDDEFEESDLVSGHVFQSPWTGKLWPRFASALDYAEREIDDRGLPRIVVGTKGAPKSQSAYMVFPETSGQPVAPTPKNVLDALASYRKAVRYSPGRAVSDDQADDDSPPSSEQLSTIETKPTAVYLASYLYVPDASVTDGDWYAADPFGFGQSVRMRKQVDQLLDSDVGLLRFVKELVGRSGGGDYDAYRRQIALYREQAELELRGRFPVDFRQTVVFEKALDMETAHQEMRALGHECSPQKLLATCQAGRQVLEALFADVARQHPLRGVWNAVYVRYVRGDRWVPQPDREVCQATYEGAYKSIGFASIPRSLLSIKPGVIRSVADYGDSARLRPLVTATALLAQRESGHPLARAAKLRPDLLDVIELIADVGGRASHSDGGLIGLEEAEAHVQRVYEVIAALLDYEVATVDGQQG